jgi:branched-chain amino acid aminotransferase
MSPAPANAWLNGAIVRWEDCVLHARSQGAFWGANVFEGVRAYRQDDDGLAMFRLDDHLARLARSMRSLRMTVDYSAADLRDACVELLRANAVTEDTHVCVVAYFGMAPNFDPLCQIEEAGVHITAVPMPRSPRYAGGAAACISSWRRISDDTMPPRIKTGANYHNSRLAQHEAVRNGYDTTLLLNQRGTVAEAPGACVVMVRDGRLVTPPATSGVLEGLTVATVAEIARDELGIDLERREIDRTELYVADEAFLCGTLAEILPITSIDRMPIGTGSPGPLTRQLQGYYDAVARGRAERPGWTTPVGIAARGRAAAPAAVGA